MEMHNMNKAYQSPITNSAPPNMMPGRFANHDMMPAQMTNMEAAGKMNQKYPAEPMMDDMMQMGTMSGRYMNEELVAGIQDCEAQCEHMTNHLKHHAKEQGRARQAMLLRDCADICGLTAKFIARGAMFARQAAAFCAMICEACGNECARFPDAMSQSCAEVCLECADHCRAFSGM
jgi:hypothetical protein